MKREIAVFLIITMVLSLSACGKTLKGTDGLIEKAREEIPISDSDTIDLQYAGMCGNDNRAIAWFATVYKGNIIKNLIMDCQSYTKYRPNETTGGIFVSWRRKEELPTGA